MEPVLGILIRVVVAYVYLLVVLRLSGKRVIGQGTPFDFIVALIVGDMPDDVIWGEVPLAQGLVGMGSVMLLHLVVVYASYRSQAFDRLIGGGGVPLIRNGDLVRHAMATERVSEWELDTMLREHGIDGRAEVRDAMLEPSGTLSVRRWDEAQPAEKRDQPALEALR